jgi:hypothetical protein
MAESGTNTMMANTMMAKGTWKHARLAATRRMVSLKIRNNAGKEDY